VTEKVISLRAHNVLCLHGFRGEGYSEAFVERLREVHARLSDDPSREVRLQAVPDVLCDACPHLSDAGCSLGGAGHEAHMRAQDVDVLRRLGCAEGEVLAWWAVLRLVADAVRGSDLPDICTTCPWLSLGWCAEGIDALAARRAPRP
jgi:hypothetical protein